MIVVVTPNPAVDVTYRVDEQRIGTTQRVRRVERRPGGKGLNVARVLAAEDVVTHSVLPLGGASGTWMADAVAALGLPVTVVPVPGETRSTITVVDDLAHPTMFGEPGPDVPAMTWLRVDEAVRAAVRAAVCAEPAAPAAPDADALVIAGSLPVGSPPDVVVPWITDALAAGALVVADLSGPALLAAADAGATICKPNRDELAEATGRTDERAGALDLLRRGAGTVVVSRGSAGIAAHTVDAVVEVPAVPGVTGNPTGAGDAATAGLVLALARGADIATALRTAAAFGAAAVLRPVAGEIDHDAAHRFTTDLETTRSHA
ncbi:tagatose 6-phosphate kinase [Curtobacterium sp. PhB130]|uniref:1-phosphofructokinase family hexose kinase n=1 Tax=Curtobacterium sp. PhB130 TaxID=2485178 RepID=UPI000F4CF05C|nr:PfkB family carbohydrate kinase [Curtobacterium sp. PhB130]ROS77658.1 tagatose 6-phosphate kinase [Curtobacterium sp. PhB130]